MELEQKLFTTALAEEIEENGEKVKFFVASDDVEDRQGEIISSDGWQLANFKKNPMLLWSHDQYSPPIGKAEKIGFKVINGIKKLVYQPIFHLKSEMSRLMADLVNGGWVAASSVGFKPLEMDGNTYTKQELLEISLVNVPANPNALAFAQSKGYSLDTIKKVLDIKESKMEEPIKEEEDIKVEEKEPVKPEEKPEKKPGDKPEEPKVEEKPKETEEAEVKPAESPEPPEIPKETVITANDEDKMFEEKGACPYKKMPLASEDNEWDAGAETKNADVKDLMKMCAWYDPENKDKKGGYKLPHHELSGYKTNLRGVMAAMGAMMGARGGVNIPDADRKGVYNHLKRHYADFDREAPEMRMADEIIGKYVEGRGFEDAVRDLTKTVNVYLEEGKVKELGETVQELKKITNDSLAEQKKVNTESLSSQEKEVTDSITEIKTFITDFTGTQNKVNEESKELQKKELTESIIEIKKFITDFIETQNKTNEESTTLQRKELTESITEIKTFVTDFIDKQNKATEEGRTLAESEKQNVESRLKGIELNIKGLSEGIKPGDEGLEQRLLEIEQNVESIAKDLRSIASDNSPEEGDDGRDPKAVNEVKDMAVKRSLVMKAFNKSVEAVNLLNKE